MIHVEVANRQSAHPIDENLLGRAAACVLAGESIRAAEISIAIVDDHEMHVLNRRHLDHDWPTDVLSFAYSEAGEALAGEIIVSADTAAAQAAEEGWSLEKELALYVVHGALHLAGYDDKTESAAAEMRTKERRYLDAIANVEPT